MRRFTETQKWEDPWFRKLKPEMKLLWQWLLDRCDNAGVIDPDIELASFQIGYQYPINTLSKFGERLVLLECKKWFIPKFINFQYGRLSSECKAHKPIFTSLQKHDIPPSLIGYPKGINTLQEEEEEKEKETEKETEDPELIPKTRQILPSNWQRMSEKDRKQSKVNYNDETMQTIGTWFGRRPETLWTVAEAAALSKSNPLQKEIEGMGKYYTATIAVDDYRRRDLLTLLNNWTSELDRARAFVTKQSA